MLKSVVGLSHLWIFYANHPWLYPCVDFGALCVTSDGTSFFDNRIRVDVGMKGKEMQKFSDA